MINNAPGQAIENRPKRIGLIDQWGGRKALFFTYVHLSHDLTTGLLSALLPFIRQDLGLNYLQTGFIVSAFSLTSGVSQILGGWAADHIGRRKAIAIGLGGIGLGAIGISQAPNYFVLLAVLIAMGICAGFYHPSAISAVTTIFDADKRGRVVALHMIGGGLGFAIGPLVGALIARTWAWQWAYIILGLPAIVASVLVMTKIQLPETPRPKGPVSKTAGKSVTVWQVFKPILLIVALSVALNLVAGPIMSFAALFLVDVQGLTAAAGSMWVSLIRVGGMIGSLIGGWLSDKWGRKNAIFLNLLLFGPIIILVARLPYGVLLGAALIIFGALISMRETNMQTYLMDRTPPEKRATVIGIYFGFGQEGSSVIQPIAGDIMDARGISWVFVGISWLATALSSLAGIYALFDFRKKKPAATPTAK